MQTLFLMITDFPLDRAQIYAVLNHIPDWTHFSEIIDNMRYFIYCEIDFFFCGEPVDPESDT